MIKQMEMHIYPYADKDYYISVEAQQGVCVCVWVLFIVEIQPTWAYET